MLNSQREHYHERLIEALTVTGATLAFDAIGGGRGINRILTAMEIAAAQRGPWSRYGSEEPKQAYIYGQLDLSATELTRGRLGVVVSGWLLTPFMNGQDPSAWRECDSGCAKISTTFASHYSSRISLPEAITVEAAQQYGLRKTGRRRCSSCPIHPPDNLTR